MVKLNDVVGQPWRCECPHCGAYGIVRAFATQRVQDKTYVAYGIGKQQIAADRAADWRCRQCNERLDDVYDNKRGEVVPINLIR